MTGDGVLRDGDPRRGAALFVVLLFSSFLAALAASAMRTSLSGVRAAAVFADGVRADELGRSAADVLAYRLATGDEAARRGGAIAVRLPGGDLTVEYLSESARVDVNLASPSLIGALLAAVGVDPAEAEAAVAAITRFRAEAADRAKPVTASDSGDGAPAGGLAALRAQVNALGPAAKPVAAAQPLAIRDPSEVARAWGLSEAAAGRALPFLTVSNGAATVDPVLAGRPILLALLGGEERADDYIERRRQGFVSEGSALELLPVPARDSVGFTDSRAVRAVVRVRVAKRFERRYEMILAPPPRQDRDRPAAPGAGGAVPVVVSWRKLS